MTSNEDRANDSSRHDHNSGTRATTDHDDDGGVGGGGGGSGVGDSGGGGGGGVGGVGGGVDSGGDGSSGGGSQTPRLVASWLIVGVPLAYGIYQTVSKTLPLFGG